MPIDVARPELWEDLNDLLKSHLSVPEKVFLRAYRGLAHAVFEVAQGSSHFMAHKKSIAAITGQTPVFETLLPYYYKEAYQVQVATRDKVTKTSEWVDSLNKDTLFVILTEDHPVTGEIYPEVDELDRLLNEKRYFVFRISHANHFFSGVEIRPYTVRLCSYGAEHALAFCGERFRSPALMAQALSWDAEEFITHVQCYRKQQVQNCAAVEKFEQALPIEQRYFQAPVERLYDRAVCVLPDANGEAVVSRLHGKKPFAEGQVMTTNLCYWRSQKTFKGWWNPAPTPEQLRGMIVISAQLLEDKDFANQFVSAYEEIQQLQSWEV